MTRKSRLNSNKLKTRQVVKEKQHRVIKVLKLVESTIKVEVHDKQMELDLIFSRKTVLF